MAQHNHPTRNIMPRGECPRCDNYWTIIDEEHARHPVESCDLFRTPMGGCTCD